MLASYFFTIDTQTIATAVVAAMLVLLLMKIRPHWWDL